MLDCTQPPTISIVGKAEPEYRGRHQNRPMRNQMVKPWTNAWRDLGTWRVSGSQSRPVLWRPLRAKLARRQDWEEWERERGNWGERWGELMFNCSLKRGSTRSGGKVRHMSGASARVAGCGIDCLGRGWFLRRILASLVIARNEVKLTAYAKHPPTARTDSPGFPLGWLPDGELNIPSTLQEFFASVIFNYFRPAYSISVE